MSTYPPNQEKMKKVLQWISDMAHDHPEKKRTTLLKEAESYFDLTPKECLFLERNFTEST